MSYFGMNISSPRTELKHDLDKTQACQAICISLYTVLSYAYTHMTYIYINNEALNLIIIRFRKRVVPHFGLIGLSLVSRDNTKHGVGFNT